MQLTGMGHVEESTGSVPLDPHVLGLGQPGERDERARLCNLRLVLICTWSANPRGVEKSQLTMSCEIGDASHCITLHLHIRAEHLPYEWFQSAKRDDEEFVFGWQALA